MPTILRQLPFFSAATRVTVGSHVVAVKAYQIIAWVSISPRGLKALDGRAPRLPVILDTGHSHSFSIQEYHLLQWAGLRPNDLPKLGDISVQGVGGASQVLSLFEASVWLHPNQVGHRNQFADRPPYCLGLDAGIAVYPSRLPYAPRLPLLGLRALVTSKLHLTIDCWRQHVTLRTPRRWWLFG